MADLKIKTTKPAVPMIYAYTTPEIKRHDGWTKIGYTEQEVNKRLHQQMHTADVRYKTEWALPAVYEDGSGETFKDTDFHRYLASKNVDRTPGTEWFHVMPQPAKNMLRDFRERSEDLDNNANATVAYKLRDEQEMAIQKAIDYRSAHEGGEFLWNCKPRFGKTLATYDLANRIGARTVLIVTNRPSIANSWYSDYVKFFGNTSYYFATNSPALKDKKYTVRSDSAALVGSKYFEFESLQDLKGSVYFGGKYDKYKKIANTTWDLLVIDEAHEGVDTYKTDVMFDHIKRKFTLHLSGTPFKALANDKFPDEAIYNWTYADEQDRKEHWFETHPDITDPNPYETLPQLNMYTYQMSEMVKGVIKEGIDINGEVEEYTFDLNEFFKTDENSKRFVHEAAVNRFLDALTTQEKYPFSTDELRNELKHTMWLLNRVDSARALAKKLKDHPVFKDYEIVLAAGDGTVEDDEKETQKAYDRVRSAIDTHDKTITLTVGQLTTGITIPEWTAVIILSNVGSPSLYMQAAFRAQNPCLFHDSRNGVYQRKERAYVFDFDPARTLDIYERFANDLNSETSDGKGSVERRESNIKRLLNFFPVIGEDTEGRMVELDAASVLSIPRQIRSTEVVKKGFMSNFLFQNISNIFSAPALVREIVQKFEPVEEPKGTKINVDDDTASELDLDDNGDVSIPKEKLDDIVDDIFGDKIFEKVEEGLVDQVEIITKQHEEKPKTDEEKMIEQLKDAFKQKIADPLVSKAKEEYGKDLSSGEQKRIQRIIETDVESKVDKAFGNYQIQQNILETEKNNALNQVKTDAEAEKVHQEFEAKKEQAKKDLKKDLNDVAHTAIEEAGKTIVEKVETHKRNVEKQNIEDQVRDHLRGFTRTIPSFLMAYGTKETTLAIFDQIIPDEVFREVTSISLDEFRFLRDGGTYVDPENGEQKFYEGHLFDEVVFNDSVQEFIALKNKLSNYFDQGQEEDIFSYIPPQKTNQVFTQKSVVQEMLDMLETENPGCFNDSEATFADLYMKSGLYIAEIVKRLFNSEELKRQYPNETDRLNHIFARQVYGLAPTEIIYRIARTFILGFSDHIEIEADNIRLCDALQFAEDGTLEAKLKELFPELN